MTSDPPRLRRWLPSDPSVRRSASLFETEAAAQGIEPARRMLFVGPEAASERIARALEVEPGQEVLARRKLLLAGDEPVRLATSFFRMDLFGETPVAGPDFLSPSLQAVVEAAGHRFGRSEEELLARPPTGKEADALQLGPAAWVVEIVRVSFDVDGTPIHALETVCKAGRHVFVIRPLPDDQEF